MSRIGDHGPNGGNHTFVNLMQMKAGTSRMTGNHTFWSVWPVLSVPEGRQRKVRKAGISGGQIQPFVHYTLIIIKLALQIKSSHHAPMP